MLTAGAAAAAVTALTGYWVAAPAVGWGVAALTYVAWVWLAIGRFNPAETRAHATAEDPSRATTDLLILAANVASLGAVAAVVVDTHASGGGSRFGGGLLALASVALSWMLVQTLFTLRYAEMYYSTGGKAGTAVGGIDFNQDGPPQYTDIAYMAISLGMTYQVSDTDLSTRHPGGGAQAQPALLSLWHRHPGHHHQPGGQPRQLAFASRQPRRRSP